MGVKLVDVDSIPRIERWTYWIVGISGIFYAIYIVSVESDRFAQTHPDTLSQGWSFLNRPRDRSDKEWSEWRMVIPTLAPVCCVRVIFCYISHWLRLKPQLYKLALCVLDGLTLSYLTTGWAVLWLIVQSTLMYAVTYTNSAVMVWVLGLSLVQALNFDSALDYKEYILGLEDPKIYNQYITAEAFFFLKLITFGLEKVRYNKTYSKQSACFNSPKQDDSTQHKGNDKLEEEDKYSKSQHISSGALKEQNVLRSDPTLIDFLFFCLSLPMFFDGPVYNFNDFHNQVEEQLNSKPPDLQTVVDILKQMLRIAFWAVFIEFQCHFLYHCVVPRFPEFVKSMNLFALIGMGYYQGQFFMVKYLCMYGLAMQWLRFEGVRAHDQPRCISWVFSYVDMWRVFDVGLYKFIKIYIFLPSGGWRSSLHRKMFSGCLAFVFIYVFHGTQTAILIWCTGNFLTNCLESLAHQVELSTTCKNMKSYLSPAMQVRLRCLLTVPVYLISCNLIFYFFFGKQVGHIFVNRMHVYVSWTAVFIQAVIYYTGIQNAMYIYDRRGCRKHVCG